MKFTEARNAIVERLESHIGAPVVLSEQSADMPEFPYCYYSVLASRISSHAFGLNETGEASRSRSEEVDATVSFTFCSKNRETEDGYVFGEDEAMVLCDKAHGFFLLDAHNIGLASGEIVMREVGSVANRSGFFIDDPIRRFGFDIRFAYVRTDEMEALPVKEAGNILGGRR